jgi:DNA-binding NarL/FixJ family response regulator
MPHVLALLDDLFFEAKITETAKHMGVAVRVCTSPDALLDEMTREKPNLIVVDLNARCQPVEKLAQIQSAAGAVPLVSFLSHVQTDLAQRARAAGCRTIMARSQFTRDLATILARAKSDLT